MISKYIIEGMNIKEVFHKMAIIIFFLIFNNSVNSQAIKNISLIQKSVYSIMFVNEQDIVQKKNMVDVHNATAFSFLYKGKPFLACAKHSVEKYYESGSSVLFAITLNKDSVVYQRGLTYYDTSLADVALIKPIDFPGFPIFKYFANDSILSLSSGNLPLLSELYLFGYPTYNSGYKTSVYRSIDENGGYSPFVKRGFISGYDKSDSSNYRYLLDVNLSKGYSGGPAYYFDSSGKRYLVGVITNTTVSNILDENYQTINNLYQTSCLIFITDVRYLLAILKKKNH